MAASIRNLSASPPFDGLAPPDLSAIETCWTPHPSKWQVVRAVARRLVPSLIEATLIPTVLFYTTFAMLDLRWALLAALGWSYTAVGRRVVRGRAVSPLLLLAAVGITVRTVIYLSSGSAFVYFVQPILGTLVTATVFAVSVLVGRPLIARFARDFCPLTPELHARPAVDLLFRRLTLLWAGVNVAVAAVSLTLLLTVPAPVFVGAKAVTVWALTCIGLVVTVSDSVRTARMEGLQTAVGPNGLLYAYATP